MKFHLITQPKVLTSIINSLISRILLEFENLNLEDLKVEFQDERNRNLKIIIDQSHEILKFQQSQLHLSQNDLQLENQLKISLVQSIIIIVSMLRQEMR